MRPKVIKGILYIPMSAIDKGRGIYTDGMIPIDKTHPDYNYWYNLLPHKKKKSLSNILTGATEEALKAKGKIKEYICEEGEEVFHWDDSAASRNHLREFCENRKKKLKSLSDKPKKDRKIRTTNDKPTKKVKKGKGVYLLFDHDVTAEGILSAINEHIKVKDKKTMIEDEEVYVLDERESHKNPFKDPPKDSKKDRKIRMTNGKPTKILKKRK